MVFGQNLPRRRSDVFSSDADFLPVPRLSRMLDSMFSDFMGTRFFSDRGALERFSPRVNITEDENEICVVAELPGMKEDDVDVTLLPNGILLRGERREEREDEQGRNGGYYEFSYGSFERFIPLQTEVKRDDVVAEFDRGLLTVTLPKSEQGKSQSKRIQIRAGERQSREQSSSGRESSERGKSEKRQGSISSEQRGSEERAAH